MNKPRIINAFLDQGLLELNGNDVWLDNIVKAAVELASYLRANPEELLTFLASALKKDTSPDDTSFQKAQEILESVWMTYRSASMGDANVIFRGIIFDAVVSIANSDEDAKLAVALYLDAVLSHIELGKEAAVLQIYLIEIQKEVSTRAEAEWTVPAELDLPAFPTIKKKSISLTTAELEIDEAALSDGISAAIAPQNAEGVATNGNPHWPNQHQHWAKEFGPRLTAALEVTFNEIAAGRKATVQASSLVDQIQDGVEQYIGNIAERLVASNKGVDLRSRLLWWKEAGVSPSARVRYGDLEPFKAASLMAKDYQAMLPALAPYSVTAFLQTCVHRLVGDAKPKKLNDIRTDINLDVQMVGIPIRNSQVFNAVEFAEFVFLYLQSFKAAAAIKPQEIVTESEVNDE